MAGGFEGEEEDEDEHDLLFDRTPRIHEFQRNVHLIIIAVAAAIADPFVFVAAIDLGCPAVQNHQPLSVYRGNLLVGPLFAPCGIRRQPLDGPEQTAAVIEMSLPQVQYTLSLRSSDLTLFPYTTLFRLGDPCRERV